MKTAKKSAKVTVLVGAPALAQTTPPPGTGMINPTFNAARPRASYAIPYGAPIPEAVTMVIDRVRDYLVACTPAKIVDRNTGAEIKDLSKPNPNATLARGDFNLVSYEWGVAYTGMLLAAEATGDTRYRDYVDERFKFIAKVTPFFRAQMEAAGQANQGAQAGRGGTINLFRSIINPRTLDDSGSMCAAMIKATNADVGGGKLRPLIENFANWITTKQQRLEDGTFSRSRPLPDSVWLDDLYMSIPSLAQLGKFTGDKKHWDDAIRQINQFAARMFNRQKGLWMHGWVKCMGVHPEFRWARANGWALLAMTELLDVLPENYPGRASVLELYRAHVRGLAEVQGKDGRWTQLLDRPDSYLETSATAIYAFCVARGVNRGWLDALAHGPMAVLAWQAVTTQVNDKGQVENVCVGTGMGFDPAFYYHRPVSPLAAHGYGPVLLAGAEMLTLAKTGRAVINDEAVMFGRAAGL
ncbi:MAG TPA: glycoside hydrolase family 88 protein [Opitutaceae bacterium]|nr:glycoside hydrolase family 88 protein [Opitutaceae bacterium]